MYFTESELGRHEPRFFNLSLCGSVEYAGPSDQCKDSSVCYTELLDHYYSLGSTGMVGREEKEKGREGEGKRGRREEREKGREGEGKMVCRKGVKRRIMGRKGVERRIMGRKGVERRIMGRKGVERRQFV